MRPTPFNFGRPGFRISLGPARLQCTCDDPAPLDTQPSLYGDRLVTEHPCPVHDDLDYSEPTCVLCGSESHTTQSCRVQGYRPKVA